MDTSIFKKLNITVYNTIFGILFLAGLTLTVFEIKIYRDTFINHTVPAFIWLLTGLFVSPFLIKILAERYATKSLFWQIFYNICTWGGIATYLFMVSNFYLADKSITSAKLTIIDTGHLAKGTYGCGEPYAEILYKCIVKQLIYPCDVPIEKYNLVELQTANGYWGFEVIKSKRLLKQ